MAAMKSPVLMPALAAGVSSIGVITLMRPSSIVTSMPTPPNSPRVWICMSLKAFCVHVARMRIERGHHALDGGVDQFAVLDGTHVILADAFEGVVKEIELSIDGVGAVRGGKQNQSRSKTCSRTYAHQSIAIHDLFAFLRSTSIQGAGLTPLPFCRNSK